MKTTGFYSVTATLSLLLAVFPAQASAPVSLRYAGYPWVVEAESATDSSVTARADIIRLKAAKGLTVWLAEPLRPPYEITYRRRVIPHADGPWRLSDLNQFWAARIDLSPAGDNRGGFHRSGAFSSYDDLPMYYVGVGGNANRTTRFRRYDGRGQRILLGEYLDAAHLLRAGHEYRVRIVVKSASTAFYLDGEPLFSSPHQMAGEGFFGFRLTGSDQEISDFKVRKLP